MDNEEFQSVLTGALAGAPWAWSRLYQSISPTVLGYFRARGAIEPEDLLGEVWLSIARQISNFAGDHDGFRSWVFVVAHHRLIDERRKRGRRPATRNVDDAAAIEPQIAHTDESLAGVELDELISRLRKLPEQQQSVVLLRVIADLSVEQTAEVLEISATAVKSVQYRAVKKLREIFEQSATNPVVPAVTEGK